MSDSNADMPVEWATFRVFLPLSTSFFAVGKWTKASMLDERGISVSFELWLDRPGPQHTYILRVHTTFDGVRHQTENSVAGDPLV